MASSCISFTAIKFNLKTITDNRNSPEYYLKLNTQSIHEKKKEASNMSKFDENCKLCKSSKYVKFNYDPFSLFFIKKKKAHFRY